MHIKDPVVHVRVRWMTETRKDPAYTCIPEDGMWLAKWRRNLKKVTYTNPLLWRNAEEEEKKEKLQELTDTLEAGAVEGETAGAGAAEGALGVDALTAPSADPREQVTLVDV